MEMEPPCATRALPFSARYPSSSRASRRGRMERYRHSAIPLRGMAPRRMQSGGKRPTNAYHLRPCDLIAEKTVSGVYGGLRSLMPTASKMAFDMAGHGPLMQTSAMDFAPKGPVGS